MAAVQPATGMAPTGGNPGMKPGAQPLMGVTKEQAQALHQEYMTMKQNGTPENDPRLIKVRQILTTLHQRREQMKRLQEAQQQQQQQQQQQYQPNGAVQPQMQQNGNSAGVDAMSNPNIKNMLQSPSTSLPSNMGGLGQQTRPVQGDAAAEHGFSKEQMAKLRAQVAAYGALQKNNSIPAHIAEVLFSRNNDPSTAADSSKSLIAGSRNGGDASTSDTSRHQFETFTDPHGFLIKHISYSDHAHRPYRPIIPSIMPHSFDPEHARAEREAIIYNRVIARKDELSKLSANIGAWDTKKSDTPEDNANTKLRALIEYKMLCLLPKQREMRAKVGKEMMLSDTLSMTANRTMYRRVKRQSLREARVTEKLEKQQRDAAESKEKKKHIEYMRSIVSHSDEIRNSGTQSRQRAQKLGRLMVQTHSNIEKEEQRRIERTAKQRLQALKANDEETYLKLLGQAKDTRITHLLKQTDGFLGQLAASVKEQQRSSQHAHQIDQDEPYPEEDEVDSEDETKRKIDYYEVAHRIKEPVTKQADMLIGGTLKDYQVKGLQWMISLYNNNLNGILADEMGLGKTIQTISLICYLIEKKKQQGPYLVLVPLSTLTNWNNEFEKWAPSIVRIVYKGPPNQRKVHAQQIRYGQFQVLLTTYEFIIKDRPLLSKVKWVHMIVDEGHRMKNANSKLSSTITQYYHTRFRLILTGTPLQNNLTELWAMLNFVLPNIFKSVKSFDEWFNTPFANTGGQDKMELTEEEQLLVIKRLHKVLRPFLLRRLKKDVEKDLPDKQERVVKCNRSALQARLYKQLVQHNRINVLDSSGKKTGMRGLSNMLMQLRKLCNHPFVFEEVEDQMNPHRLTNDLIWRTSGKFELLDRVLPKFKATNHRVLMFFQMTQIMNIMEDFLRFRGIKYLRLDGSTKADDRSELLRLFNAPGSEYFCFLLSTRAGGLGLNLQTADTVIIYDSDWNPHQDLQAQDRAHRIGQKNEVRILRLITSNSVEEKILERAQFKLDMDGKVIQAGKFDNKSTNEERDEMLRIMLEAAESSGETAEQEDEMDDDELNMIMARNEDEVLLFQKMDQERLKSDPYGPEKTYQRLLGDSELPELYLNDDNPVVEEIETNYGRGTRERAKVKYDDGLTEEQWLDAVDADDDTIEAAIARKQARIARRSAKKAARANGGADSPGGDDDDDSDDGSEEEEVAPQPKKRSRKSAGAVTATPRAAEKRKAVDDLDSPASAAPPPKKRGRVGKAAETLSKEDRESLQSILDIVHDSLQDLEEASTEPGVPARGIIDPFLELPPKQYYPDYYDLIKNPICMKQIENKINRKQYQNVRQFREDLGLLCRNCRQYNEDGSVLYQDANLIESAALEKLTQETAKFPRWKNFEQPEAADADAKAAATNATNSAVGTPQPPARSGFKLKLGGPKTPATSAAAKGDEE